MTPKASTWGALSIGELRRTENVVSRLIYLVRSDAFSDGNVGELAF